MVVESEEYVAVGTPVARRPPHRSGRAGLQHPAPTGLHATVREAQARRLSVIIFPQRLRRRRAATERLPRGRRSHGRLSEHSRPGEGHSVNLDPKLPPDGNREAKPFRRCDRRLTVPMRAARASGPG